MADFAKKYPNVSSDDLNSAIKSYCVKLRLKPDATPVFLKPYSLPYKMLDKVSSKLKNPRSISSAVRSDMTAATPSNRLSRRSFLPILQDRSIRTCSFVSLSFSSMTLNLKKGKAEK